MQTVHLGATLTEAVDNRREILKKVGEANSIANRLKVFWSKARTTKRWKLRVLNSVIFGKLLYGLETDSIDAFQMKMLRRVLQVPPTHVDREWTNQKVSRTLTDTAKYKHVRLSEKWETWRKRKITLLGHILRSHTTDPMTQVLLEQGTFAPRIEHTRRVGKPSASWLIETCKEAFPISNPHTGFDINSSDQMRHLADWATHRQAPFGVNQ